MYLGIDIGTSAVKAVIINDDHDVVEQSTAPLQISRPHPNWSEQNPDDWWKAASASVTALQSSLRGKIQSIGLSGQMHGAILLDDGDRVLRPAILWNDGRSVAECTDLERVEPRSRAITANLAMPGFTAPKLVWVRRHEPHLFDQIHKVLLPKDYVRLRMTGDYASDMSDAAGTLWLDVAGRKWSGVMLDATGLTRSHMPALYEGSEIAGMLRSEIAQKWGVPSVPVVAGGGDNAAGAVGVGVREPGDAFLSLGTSGVIFLAGDHCIPDPEAGIHAFCHALPGRWHQMAVMLSAAVCVDWAARLTGQCDAGQLIAGAQKRDRLDGDEIFLPYLAGERTPHNNPHARGVFFGLHADTDAVAIGQSVLEGVAIALADGLDALRTAGAEVNAMTVIGGGARSRYWGRILAAALERPLIYRRYSDVGPAFGAARLAHAGLSGIDAHALCSPPAALASIEPLAADIEALAGKKARFRNIYKHLKDDFRGDD